MATSIYLSIALAFAAAAPAGYLLGTVQLWLRR